jgi:hypothetical protein
MCIAEQGFIIDINILYVLFCAKMQVNKKKSGMTPFSGVINNVHEPVQKTNLPF